MSSRKPDPLPAIHLAMLLLGRVEECIEQLKETADQLGQSRDNKDASRVARERSISSSTGSRAFR
jgi:hypothetical protein